jgi:hypothetical protein
MDEPDDPRFEWICITAFGSDREEWIRGQCKHLNPIPVHARPTGELVAKLCPDCDVQLSVPDPSPAWLNTPSPE